MYERFTDRARKVMQLACQEAQRLNHDYLGTEHILLGLGKEGVGVAACVLKNLDIDLRKLRMEVAKIHRPGPDMVIMGKLPQTPRAKNVIEKSIEEATNLDDNYVDTEHLLLALIRDQESVAAQVLMSLGLNLQEIRGGVLGILGCEISVEESAMYERFTDRARKVMQLANQEAMRFNHEYIGTEHILLGLVKEGSGVAANVLKNLDIDLRKIRLEIEKIVMSGPDMVTMGRLPQTPMAKKAIEYAIEEARLLKTNYVGTEHLLLGLLRHADSVAAQVLMNLGLNLEEVREETRIMLGIPQEKEDGEQRRQQPAKKQLSEKVVQEEKRDSPVKSDPAPSVDGERLRSLEQQLWNVRLVLGAVVGALAGALLLAQFGAIMGLLLGGLVAALGWRSVGVVAGGVTGVLLGCTHLPNEGGGLAVALLGAVVGFLIAEIGGPSKRR